MIDVDKLIVAILAISKGGNKSCYLNFDDEKSWRMWKRLISCTQKQKQKQERDIGPIRIPKRTDLEYAECRITAKPDSSHSGRNL